MCFTEKMESYKKLTYKNMELKNLKKEELLKLKNAIEVRLKDFEKCKLTDLETNDEIFCIKFKDSIIWNMDYVKINFYKNDIRKDFVNFLTSHDSKPMGCGSSVEAKCMNNHCFLSDFGYSLYFFTLKPENWKNDLVLEIERISRLRVFYTDLVISELENRVYTIINSNKNSPLKVVNSSIYGNFKDKFKF